MIRTSTNRCRVAHAFISRRAAIGLTVGGISWTTRAMASSPALQDEAFRREVLATMARLRPKLLVKLHSEPNMLLVSDRFKVSLDNLQRHLEKTSDPANRESAIVAFIEQATQQEAKDSTAVPFAEIKANLYPHLAPAEYVARMSGALIHRVFPSNALVEAMAIDSVNSLEVVQQKHLDAWAVTADAVHAIALANLERFSQTITLNPHRYDGRPGAWDLIEASRYTLANGNAFGSSAALVLAPGFMTRFRSPIAPSLFVGIPDRGTLVAWSADFDKRKEIYARVRQDFERRPHPVSPELFVSSAAGLRLATPRERADHGVK